MKLRKEPIIVGIDPGITTAYAVLDIDGKPIKLKSSKNLNLSKLLLEITSAGKVMVVGTDVKHNPNLIEKFATKLSTKIITPKEDMKIGFKKRITKEFRPRDDHQRDALAAALNAFKEIRPLLLKVDRTLKREGKEHLISEVKELVLKGHTISNALESFEKKTIEPIKRKRIRKKFKTSSKLLEENQYLKDQNFILKEKMDFLENKMNNTIEKINSVVNEKIKDKIIFKNKKIDFLINQLRESKKEAEQLKKEILKVNELFLKSKGKIVAKKLKTLSWKEINSIIKEKDILLVDDVNAFSDKSLDYLKEKSNTIIYKKQPTKKLFSYGIPLINAKNLSIIENNDIALVDQEQLDKERNKKDILSNIVDSYKKEREKSLI